MLESETKSASPYSHFSQLWQIVKNLLQKTAFVKPDPLKGLPIP